MILINKALQRQAYDYCGGDRPKRVGKYYHHKCNSYALITYAGLFRHGIQLLEIPRHVVLSFSSVKIIVESDSDMWLSLNLENYASRN